MNYPNTQLHIDGQWCDAAAGETLAVLNPATGMEIGRLAHARSADLNRALKASERGFETWRDMPAIERAKLMRRSADIFRSRADEVACLLTQEQGKPLHEAKSEILAAVDIIEWFADESLRIYGRIVPSRHSLALRQMVLRDPVGPVAAFTPWNFPINQVSRKVSAALAAGCSMIVKGSEETPASVAALIQAFAEAGLPPGVLGLVYGDPAEISQQLISHPIIRKITFTGSTQVGKRLAQLAGLHMKRVTMELGGHAPVIVAEDADIELAVRASGGAKFRNAGQICIAPTRFLVHRDVQEAFTTEFVRFSQSLRVGNGLHSGTTMGPLANARRVEAMADMTRDAVHKGAVLACGGSKASDTGHFWQPTVLSDVPLDAKVFNDEPFGPIAAIRSFTSLDEAVSEANRLPYGLGGYAFTKSLKHSDFLARRMQVGMLWVNLPAVTSAEMPFGGVKDSGYGSEGGPEAIDAYLHSRAVSIMNV